ncbi:polymerase II transcription elongation factor [Mycena chlorophos]|uniref:Polymerase II transcription elongation factor n=1 Tax=Mycena chlorophos TaxID=658473 RepID=A0A8H6RZY4_MYCCL|nr:polymerase II transcription elongation factor [Mycena chlorophos]
MGTRGYKVYRYNGRYFIRYNHLDSYPSALGVSFSSQIPRTQEAYQEWLERLKKTLEEYLEKMTASDGDDSEDDFEFRVSTEPPENDLFIEWIYTIDLDHEVFLVDSNPLYSLKNMPPTGESFCRYIGFDNYGRRSYKSTTPAKYRYNWTAPPPTVEDKTIEAYNALLPHRQTVDINVLLGASMEQPLPAWESARVALYEVVVGGKMRAFPFSRDINTLESIAERNAIPRSLVLWGQEALKLGFGPMKFGSGELLRVDGQHDPDELFWLVPDAVAVRFTTHLDDERNFKRQVLLLVEELPQEPTTSTFGILFSFFHCAIVHVHNGTVSHTPAMRFLPNKFAGNPSTRGLTALARQADMSGTVSNDGHYLHSVPNELLERITSHLFPVDLDNLALAAPTIFCASVDRWRRYPFVRECRLESVHPLLYDDDSEDEPAIPEDEESDEDDWDDDGDSPRILASTCTRHFAATSLDGMTPKGRVRGVGWLESMAVQGYRTGCKFQLDRAGDYVSMEHTAVAAGES